MINVIANTDIITIALDKLDRDPKNVRKTYRKEGIEELAANIRADGYRILQNIVVRKADKRGRFFVIAGERRRLALNLLAEAGEDSDHDATHMIDDAEDDDVIDFSEAAE
ncbi:ParB/Srx family N-terminal domain-containing protein [Rhizobium sp. YK2]|uniref:ParB/Srx family N-terminal domain-containing protein n=1 Tax=Rhizobium sp. YK2 TaxID=1860096 RepID=UPI00084BE191|nr:ParB/Srx family N-terminal domain-containing protein [Rhizobium sp. YK2]OED00966.1 hypothetical protein A9Z06_13605 [Rhizobium sp. YK2]